MDRNDPYRPGFRKSSRRWVCRPASVPIDYREELVVDGRGAAGNWAGVPRPPQKIGDRRLKDAVVVTSKIVLNQFAFRDRGVENLRQLIKRREAGKVWRPVLCKRHVRIAQDIRWPTLKRSEPDAGRLQVRHDDRRIRHVRIGRLWSGNGYEQRDQRLILDTGSPNIYVVGHGAETANEG